MQLFICSWHAECCCIHVQTFRGRATSSAWWSPSVHATNYLWPGKFWLITVSYSVIIARSLFSILIELNILKSVYISFTSGFHEVMSLKIPPPHLFSLLKLLVITFFSTKAWPHIILFSSHVLCINGENVSHLGKISKAATGAECAFDVAPLSALKPP